MDRSSIMALGHAKALRISWHITDTDSLFLKSLKAHYFDKHLSLNISIFITIQGLQMFQTCISNFVTQAYRIYAADKYVPALKVKHTEV